MNKKDLTEVFSYIAFASTEDEAFKSWLKENDAKIEEFFTWSNGFEWNK